MNVLSITLTLIDKALNIAASGNPGAAEAVRIVFDQLSPLLLGDSTDPRVVQLIKRYEDEVLSKLAPPVVEPSIAKPRSTKMLAPNQATEAN